jgi:hypothetical protein
MTFQYFGPMDPDSPLYQQRSGMDYDNGQKIDDLALYIVDACLDAAKEGTQKYFTINGSRQSGKTSLLLEIAQHIKEVEGYPCRIDFQSAYGATPEASINFMARKILRAIPELGSPVKVPDKFEYDGFEFDNWLWELPIPKDKPVVLLLEELGALPLDSRKRLGGLLRGAFDDRRDKPWDRVMLVFFGGIELYEMITIEVSPLINICMNISLLDLSPIATHSLIASGFSKVGVFETAQLSKMSQSIYDQVAGHPYLTQYLGEKALTHTQKNGTLPSDIQSVLSQLPAENSKYFHYLYQSIQKYELVDVTKSLFQKQINIHPDENAIYRLGLLGVLSENTEKGTSFRNQLIQNSLEKILFANQNNATQVTSFVESDNGSAEIEGETFVIRENMIKGLLKRFSKLACMATAGSRHNLLIKSGIEGLHPGLDVKGDVNAVIPRLFYFLEKLPRLPNGYHPLGLFLTGIKTSLKRDEEEITTHIDAFITQYGLMGSKSEKYERAVFVSYAWGSESERTVDELEQAFAGRGIRIVRDKKELSYKDSIEEFEQRIGQGQCIILVISDKYLRSEHCMYELVEVDENRELRERIFPIVLTDAHIYKAIDRLTYIKYWDAQIKQLNQDIKQIDGEITNLDGIIADLKKYKHIRDKFDQLIGLLKDMNTLTPEVHANSGFATLINAVEAAQA